MADLVSHFEAGISGAFLLSVIAFSTVFIVLIGLTLVIYCVRFLSVSKKDVGRGDTGSVSASVPQTPPPSVPAQQPPMLASREEDAAGEELVAVIAAAVAASASAWAPRMAVAPAAVAKFNLWKAAARVEQMEGFED
jgi:Na+-transporting methylmalonyl-CoA/oxaloacetate decarboxylase gamma subunit